MSAKRKTTKRIRIELQDENPFLGQMATVKVFRGKVLIKQVKAELDYKQFGFRGDTKFKDVIAFRRIR